MQKIIIIRYCEIHLKGKNRKYFENLLLKNIKAALKEFSANIYMINGRYIVENIDNTQADKVLNKLAKVSGIHSYSAALKIGTDLEQIYQAAKTVLGKIDGGSFKVVTNRADKKYPLNSVEISREIGGRLLEENNSLKVDIKNPSFTVNIDLRERGICFVYCEIIKGLGGMPLGSAGGGLLLLSGGIDSPVAGYMLSKRGMKVSAVHFHSYPYTGVQAKEKVLSLAKVLSEYTLGLRLYFVSLTDIQEQIHKRCPPDMMITLTRRCMMRIAEKIALKNKLSCLITGESLGQVASQTIEGLTVSESALEKLAVLRPLIAFDKLDIIEISEKIGSFELSILPYEDCCTVFLPKHPLIKPKLESVIEAESALDLDELISRALENIEVTNV